MKRWMIPFLVLLSAFPLMAQTWEYRIIFSADKNFEENMVAVGKEGWELVFARRATSDDDGVGYEMIFKRKADEINPQRLEARSIGIAAGIATGIVVVILVIILLSISTSTLLRIRADNVRRAKQ